MRKVVLQFGGSSETDLNAFTKAIQYLVNTHDHVLAEWIFVVSPGLLRQTQQVPYIGYIPGNKFVRNRYKTVVSVPRVLGKFDDFEKYTIALEYLEDRLGLDKGSLHSPSRLNRLFNGGRKTHDLIVEGVNQACDGYGGSTISLLRHLKTICNVGFVPIYSTLNNVAEPGIRELITAGVSSRYLIYRSPTPGWYEECLRARPRNARKIFMTMFEADRVPTTWKGRIGNKVDMIVVPSAHCKNVFLKDGWNHLPIVTVPLGFREDIFEYKPRTIPTNRPYRFLFQFANHPLADDRKNTVNVLNAFNMCFANNKDVELVIKVSGQLDLALMQTLPSNVKVIKEVLPVEGLRDLFYEADCFLFPTRGEGYGLPPREAMGTGMPVIITDFAGLADIADPSICFPIKPKKLIPSVLPQPVADLHQNGNRLFGSWADVSAHLIAEQMMLVYENQEQAIKIGKNASKHMHSKETSRIAAEEIFSLITSPWDFK